MTSPLDNPPLNDQSVVGFDAQTALTELKLRLFYPLLTDEKELYLPNHIIIYKTPFFGYRPGTTDQDELQYHYSLQHDCGSIERYNTHQQLARYAVLGSILTTVEWLVLALKRRVAIPFPKKPGRMHEVIHALYFFNDKATLGLGNKISVLDTLIQVRRCIANASGLLGSSRSCAKLRKNLDKLPGIVITYATLFGRRIEIKPGFLETILDDLASWLPIMERSLEEQGLIREWREVYISYWMQNISIDHLVAIDRLTHARAVEAIPCIIELTGKGDAYAQFSYAVALLSLSKIDSLQEQLRTEMQELSSRILDDIVANPISLSIDHRAEIDRIGKALSASTRGYGSLAYINRDFEVYSSAEDFVRKCAQQVLDAHRK